MRSARQRGLFCRALCLIAAILVGSVCLSGCGASGAATNNSTNATSSASPVTSPGADTTKGASAKVTLIGDSVPLGAVSELKADLPGITLLVDTDRTLSGAGLTTLKQESKQGKLGDIVVLALGTNYLVASDIDQAMKVIGSQKQVVFVNCYRNNLPYVPEVNATIAAAAKKYANFTVCDWYGYVKSHPDLQLADDNCHLTASSAQAYADLIKQSVDSVRAKVGD